MRATSSGPGVSYRWMMLHQGEWLESSAVCWVGVEQLIIGGDTNKFSHESDLFAALAGKENLQSVLTSIMSGYPARE
jgi:predicted aconitase